MGEVSDSLMSDKRRQNVLQAVKAYGRKLFSFIRAKVNTDEDAEDILQDVWFQLSNVTSTETIEQLSGWLFAVARNKIADKFRKKKPELLDDYAYTDEEGVLTYPDILLTADENPEAENIRKIFWDELFHALEELPENQRLVFVQNELEDKTLQQIADETGENLKTIISRKRYAVQHLRRRLEHLYREFMNF